MRLPRAFNRGQPVHSDTFELMDLIRRQLSRTIFVSLRRYPFVQIEALITSIRSWNIQISVLIMIGESRLITPVLCRLKLVFPYHANFVETRDLLGCGGNPIG